jgi:hypothetical protein
LLDQNSKELNNKKKRKEEEETKNCKDKNISNENRYTGLSKEKFIIYIQMKMTY